MTEESENTTLLEGTEGLPSHIKVLPFLKSRAKEIHALENSIAQTSGTKLIFQKLPVHMRRRAMSHKVKRLPRKYHDVHLRQLLKSGIAKVQKKSRKYRRRPTRLLSEYTRRQKNITWLETHIWHAKRFHMTNRWNYRLPEQPCDKAFRSRYRASAKHCLIQDISYISCVEISGPEETLTSHFKLLSNTATGLTISARAFRSGAREGSTVFYHKNSYPFKAIGQVNFIWKPAEPTSSRRTIWVWIHPSFYSELINCVIDTFDLKKTNAETSDTDPVYENSVGIQLIELKSSLNRFRLTGPLSHAVLTKALYLVPNENKSAWFTNYLESPENKYIYEKQISYWNLLQSINFSSELSPHLILNMVVVDPRYNLPFKRTKAVHDYNENTELDICDEMKYGQIWCADIRKSLSNNVSTSEIINSRKSKLVPDTTVPSEATVMPVMLVQQPGVKEATRNLGYCSGWDIIFPSNWGRAFWISFIMRGARAGGIREFHSLQFEQGQSDFLAPDTEAGRSEEARLTQLYRKRFFSLPPNKRPNYNKLGIVSPFNFRWKTLIEEWTTQSKPVDSFYVLRDRKKLNILQEMLANMSLNVENVDINFAEHCLVPVRLNFISKGRMRRYSVICLGENNDVQYKNEPNEPIYKDEHKKLRKDLRHAHQKLLKKMRRERKKARADGNVVPLNKEEIDKQAGKMESLWLPEPKNIRKSCLREVFGFVTNGDFSFTSGRGRCVGYVVLEALPKLLNNNIRNIVLVRDIRSRQYRLANIEFICL